MPKRLPLCENCGAKLDVAHLWRHRAVCFACFTQLSNPKPETDAAHQMADRRASLYALTGIVAIIITAVAIFALRKPASHPLGHPALATDSRPPAVDPHPTSHVNKVPLSWQLTPRPRTSTGPTSEPVTSVVVSGTVWLSDKDGIAELQTGLHIHLLSATAPRSAVQNALEIEQKDWRDFAEVYTRRAAESVTDPAGDSQPARTSSDQTIADESLVSAFRIESVLPEVPAEADTLAAFNMLTDLALFKVPKFDEVLSDVTLAESDTDDDGNYQLTNIPTGDYCIYAVKVSGRSVVHWCVPLHVGGGGQFVNLDLHNENVSVSYRTK